MEGHQRVLLLLRRKPRHPSLVGASRLLRVVVEHVFVRGAGLQEGPESFVRNVVLHCDAHCKWTLMYSKLLLAILSIHFYTLGKKM